MCGMKPHFCIAVVLGSLLLSGALPAHADAPRPVVQTVYVIPIKGMIERGLVYVIRRGAAQAAAEGAAAIILDMDTPGGRVDAAEDIINSIGALPIKTYTYVNPNAISAGAIIAMATDHIYMAPGSRIGDAMPIMMNPLGAPQQLPEGVEEKSVSYVAGLIRSAAQRKGHDDKLAECMVRREIEYKIGEDVICPEGQLLTLTNGEAERTVVENGVSRNLLSAGTMRDMDALLDHLGFARSEVVELEVTLAERIARYIEMLSAIFLMGGLLGLYIEFKTPGFGLPGIAGILLLAIWFWGHHVAGLAGLGEMTLFTIGVLLLFVEILFIPGFGVVGTAGICCMAGALMMAMVQHGPGLPWYNLPRFQFEGMVLKLGLSLLGTVALGALLAGFLPRTHLFQRIALMQTESTDKGYRASEKTEDFVGLRGTADTPLRPGGIGLFGDRRLNVITHGEYVAAGSPIVIAQCEGNRIVVEIESSTG